MMTQSRPAVRETRSLNNSNSNNRSEQFAALILPHQQSLYAPAMALTRSAADAEDLVQETLLRAFDRFETFRSDGSPRAWLHTIMRNMFFNMHRKKSREPKHVSLDVFEPTAVATSTGTGIASATISGTGQAATAPPPSVHSPERIVIRQMETDAVLRAVRELPDEYRIVVALADIQGMAYQEIADRLNIPVGTVRSRLSRGRDRVRRSLLAWRPSSVGAAASVDSTALTGGEKREKRRSSGSSGSPAFLTA